MARSVPSISSWPPPAVTWGNATRRTEFLSTRYGDIIHGKDPAADLVLAPYDVVYVPKTGIAEVYRYFNQYVQQFVRVSWGFSYSLGPGAAITH